MSSTTSSAFGSVAARASAPSTTKAAAPAATSVGGCSRSPAAGACSRHSGRKSGTTGRPEADQFRVSAIGLLGSGLSSAKLDEDALSVKEAELSTLRRLDDSEHNILIMQGNLANTYSLLGRKEEALSLRQETYSACVRFFGEEHETLRAASNYAASLYGLQRFEEAKALFRKTVPTARRVLGEGHRLALKMSGLYAQTLYKNDGATLDDLREAVATLEDTERIARRVLGGAHPITAGIENQLRYARAALRARETPSPPPGSA